MVFVVVALKQNESFLFGLVFGKRCSVFDRNIKFGLDLFNVVFESFVAIKEFIVLIFYVFKRDTKRSDIIELSSFILTVSMCDLNSPSALQAVQPA